MYNNGRIGRSHVFYYFIKDFLSFGNIYSPTFDVHNSDDWSMIALLQLCSTIMDQISRGPVITHTIHFWGMFLSFPENSICPRWSTTFLAGVKIVAKEVVLVGWWKCYCSFNEILEDITFFLLFLSINTSSQSKTTTG